MRTTMRPSTTRADTVFVRFEDRTTSTSMAGSSGGAGAGRGGGCRRERRAGGPVGSRHSPIDPDHNDSTIETLPTACDNLGGPPLRCFRAWGGRHPCRAAHGTRSDLVGDGHLVGADRVERLVFEAERLFQHSEVFRFCS